jgi:hypothetical protein
VCGGPFTVVCGKKPNVCYGCPNYRFRDTCTNKVTILWVRLEQQLIAALSANLVDPSLEEAAKREIQKRIKKLVLTPKQTPNGTVLEVTGDVALFQNEGVMVNNLLDENVQHYTQPTAFVFSTVVDPRLPLQ